MSACPSESSTTDDRPRPADAAIDPIRGNMTGEPLGLARMATDPMPTGQDFLDRYFTPELLGGAS